MIPYLLNGELKFIENIKNRKADIGMSSKQVLIAIGYPDEIKVLQVVMG